MRILWVHSPENGDGRFSGWEAGGFAVSKCLGGGAWLTVAFPVSLAYPRGREFIELQSLETFHHPVARTVIDRILRCLV